MVKVISQLVRPQDSQIAERLADIINPHFDFDVKKRISIRSDMNQYNSTIDEGVWEQGKGIRPHYYELYWDDVWICDFTDRMNGAAVLLKFLEGFKNAYEDDQITLHELADWEMDKRLTAEDELTKEIQEMEKEKSVEYTDNIARQVIIETLKDKRAKKSKGRKNKYAKK
jgi:hypothetical protein